MRKANAHDEEWEREDEELERLISNLEKLGFGKLARDISDERFARRIVEAQRVVDYYSLSDELWQMKEDRILQDETQFLTAIYDKGSSYTNVVLTLGYAGFFAIWAQVHHSISFVTNAWVGFFLGFSLIVYIVWTLIGSVFMTLGVRARANALDQAFPTRQEHLDAVAAANYEYQLKAAGLLKWWPLAFGSSAFTGLFAGLILLMNLLSQMVGFDWGDIVHYTPAK